jgi:hypothetical protein
MYACTIAVQLVSPCWMARCMSAIVASSTRNVRARRFGDVTRGFRSTA